MTCPTGKVRYQKRAHAKDAMKAMVAHGYIRPKELVVFTCEQCGFLHLGHKRAANGIQIFTREHHRQLAREKAA